MDSLIESLHDLNLCDETLQNNMKFYKQSLVESENEIEKIHKTGKALKDIVGSAYETHRARIWRYFGFDVSKDRHGALFNVDLSITYNGDLVALEEDKGHYVDSCFLERALTGFCKTVNAYNKKGKPIPYLILHSFTQYTKFDEKFKEDMDTRKTEIKDQVQKHLYDCYSSNALDELIMKDIQFIQSLIPVS